MRLRRVRVMATAALVAAVLASRVLSGQTAPPQPLDAVASDPLTMGWMAGSPPPPDKRIRFS